jgi:hypothetical protein
VKITEAMRKDAKASRELVEERWAEFVKRGFLERSRARWALDGEREEQVYRLGWEVGYLAALADGARVAEALMREAAKDN